MLQLFHSWHQARAHICTSFYWGIPICQKTSDAVRASMEAFESARWLRLTAWPLLLAPKICRILAPKGEFRYQLVISSTLKLRNPWIAAIGTLTLDFSMRFRLSPMGASRRAVNSEAAGQRATVLEHLNARHRGTTPNHSEKS